MIDDIVFISQITIKSSIGVLFAATGEIFTEKSGILNLGVEGMMLAGALIGAAIGLAGGPPLLALGGGMLAGAVLAMLHAFSASLYVRIRHYAASPLQFWEADSVIF